MKKKEQKPANTNKTQEKTPTKPTPTKEKKKSEKQLSTKAI